MKSYLTSKHIRAKKSETKTTKTLFSEILTCYIMFQAVISISEGKSITRTECTQRARCETCADISLNTPLLGVSIALMNINKDSSSLKRHFPMETNSRESLNELRRVLKNTSERQEVVAVLKSCITYLNEFYKNARLQYRKLGPFARQTLHISSRAHDIRNASRSVESILNRMCLCDSTVEYNIPHSIAPSFDTAKTVLWTLEKGVQKLCVR